MDLIYVENLINKVKKGDNHSKELIIDEFTPYICKLAKNTHINGFEYLDILNECYCSLLKAIDFYDINKHRFVAYAFSSIRNNINDLIKKTIKHSEKELLYDTIFEARYDCSIDDNLIINDLKNKLNDCINSLTTEEYKLYKFFIIENKTPRDYAYLNNVLYQTAYNRKKKILNKLSQELMPLI